MVNYSLYPICDTSILIDLKHINKLDEYLCFKKYISIADKVKDELFDVLEDLEGYKHYLDLLKMDNLIIIEARKYFTAERLKVIENNLRLYKLKNVVGTKNRAKNAGEFVSAFYAIELGIEELITSDNTFIGEYGNEPVFKKLSIKNLNSVLRDFLNDKERINCQSKLEIEKKKMDKAKEKRDELQVKKDKPAKSMDDLLIELKNRYSK